MDNKRSLKRNDEAISAVVGAILIIAVTVVLAGGIYLIVGALSDEPIEEAERASFSVQSIDTDNDGATDRIRVTYLSGPAGLNANDVKVSIAKEDGSLPTTVRAAPSAWTPGNFTLYSGAGTYLVTVTINDNTVVNTVARLEE